MEQHNIKLPGHLLRGDRRAFQRNSLGCIKTIAMRKLAYPLMILGFIALFFFGIQE